MTELQHKFTNDILFKMLFVKYPHLLKKLVAVLLGISVDSIKDFTIRNPEMPPESLGDMVIIIQSENRGGIKEY